MNEISPCKGCTERHLACHDSCDRYKEWRSRYRAQQKHLKETKSRFHKPWSPAQERTYRAENKYNVFGHKNKGGAL